ncbi:MoaD/ThiS family protein [Symmachiella dynata]|uniref:MoaD/ThiS family protein n=1 Tax=Symmachiella dynata TaxID=2527995 RepID=UPI0030EF69D8|tara:strand:- start:239 stop:505 length:267 start_codon:yes stop_codon:yes gene_type:complete
MPIHVELFGIPRQRAGVKELDVTADDLQSLLLAIGRELPQLLDVCLDHDGRLKSGYLANINGRAFVTAAETPLTDGDNVLILSADAGG